MKPLCAFCSILSNGCHENNDFYKKNCILDVRYMFANYMTVHAKCHHHQITGRKDFCKSKFSNFWCLTTLTRPIPRGEGGGFEIKPAQLSKLFTLGA